MLARLREHLRRTGLLRPGERVAAAVSGGADSVAMLRALRELSDEFGLQLSAAHVNHGIRGDEADGDERFVRELAQALGLPCHVARVDAPGEAQRRRLSLEAAARELRYEFFAKLIAAGEATTIVTAHTMDDQAETVLLRLLRGSGAAGLAAIPAERPLGAGRVARPMLGLRRREIEAYLRELHQDWREDSSNANDEPLRNRVRHELTPLLETWNPSIRETLAQTAAIASAEEEHWRGVVDELMKDVGEQGMELRRYAALETSTQRRLLRRMAEELGARLDFDATEKARAALARGAVCELALDGRLRLRLARKRPQPAFFALFLTNNVEKPSALMYDYPIRMPGEWLIPEAGLRLRGVMTAASSGEALSGVLLHQPLRVRNWRPGDRYHARGRGGEKKLKELFALYGVPAALRSSRPVVLDAQGEIVWAQGVPASARHAASPEDPQAWIIAVEPINPGQ